MEQQIYLQFDSHPTIKQGFEFQEMTMQVPFSRGSILMELWWKNVTAAEAIIYLSLNHTSTWDNGRTRFVNQSELAQKLGMARGYFRKNFDSLLEKGWLKLTDTTEKGKRYRLVHHLCPPEDVPKNAEGKPLKFVVPFGQGGPFERLYAGDISWKSCLVWMSLKYESDWETGVTKPCTLLLLSKCCRFSAKTIPPLLEELRDAEMLVRLSKSREKAVFQLYPKPVPKPESNERPKKPVSQRKTRRLENGVVVSEMHWYSSGGKYRMSQELGEMEIKDGKEWRRVRDRERHEIPPAVHTEMEWCLKNKNRIILTGDDYAPQHKRKRPDAKQKPSDHTGNNPLQLENGNITADEKYWYSPSGRTRCCRKTFDISRLFPNDGWKVLSELYKRSLPLNLIEAFDYCIKMQEGGD